MKKLSKVLPELMEIAQLHGLRINRAKDWQKIVKIYNQNYGG